MTGEKCYCDSEICKGPLWQCQTCGEWFCHTHWHETDKGRNVECVVCERQRKGKEAVAKTRKYREENKLKT